MQIISLRETKNEINQRENKYEINQQGRNLYKLSSSWSTVCIKTVTKRYNVNPTHLAPRSGLRVARRIPRYQQNKMKANKSHFLLEFGLGPIKKLLFIFKIELLI